MGCDIHAVIEYRPASGVISTLTGTWHIYRDYRLFAALAGVRGDPGKPPLFQPRGLPPEHSDYVSDLYFTKELVDGHRRARPDSSWHSASWLTVVEIRAALSHAGLSLEECEPEFRAVVATMDELDRCCGAGASRLVFWFDN